MAPMVRFGLKSQNGIMGEELLNLYLNAAAKDIGFIISQALPVCEKGENLGRPCAYKDSHIEYLSKIADSCHKNKTMFFIQLSYPGFGFYDENSKDINQLSKEDLIKIRDEFVNAALICKKAGADGVEFHGAHTFFLNMMASDCSNKRCDAYGKDMEGRLKLIKEIVHKVKEFSDDDFIISYRMGWTKSLDEDIEVAKALEALGMDMLHISNGIPNDRKLNLPPDFQYNDIVYTALEIKKHVAIPVICVNDIRTIKRGNYLIENNLVDFIAYGKPFLADESFVIKSWDNDEYEPCLKCKTCQWFADGSKCPNQIKLKNQ